MRYGYVQIMEGLSTLMLEISIRHRFCKAGKVCTRHFAAWKWEAKLDPLGGWNPLSSLRRQPCWQAGTLL